MLAAVFGILIPVQAYAAWWWPFGQDGVAYKIAFSGADGEVNAWFEKLKLDAVDSEHVVATDAELDQELAARGQRVRQALEALGYYDAVITQTVRRNKDTKVLAYGIQAGPRYVVGKIIFEWDGAPLKEIDTATLRSKVGQPVNAEMILADSVDVLDKIGERACLLELDVSPLVKLYENKRHADVVFRVRHGAAAKFGPTTVSGTERVHDSVVLRNVTWREGRCYRRKKVDETRTNLIQSQLFSSVTISHSTVPDALGEVPMTVDVKERAARTLKAGASFSTDDGVVVNGGWEHRNLWGGGEKFDADVSVGQKEQSLKTTLKVPDFMQDKQTLVLTGNVDHEDRDAYLADTIETGASLERKLAKHWRGGLGTAFALKKVEDTVEGDSRYALISFPGFLEYDSRNDVLDPKRGILGNITVTPYTETFGDGGQFLKTQGSAQTYLSAVLPLSPTLALKVAGGSISGADGDAVPSDIRFYAGGGGSVRGYGYQTLGPRKDNTVVGGNSFVLGSAEARLRFTDEFGGVVFTDMGNAYADTTPDLSQKLYSSVGVGARYYTSIGPIRADIAVPLNGKDIGAAGYAVYISIGQSF